MLPSTGAHFVSSKKILIMPSRSEPSREGVPPHEEGIPVAPGPPIAPSDMRTVFTAVDLYRSLGRLEHAVEVLKNANVRHEKDLYQLGKIAHTAKTLGAIALSAASGLGIVILIYLIHHFAPLLFSK
jgi:hypothetical protein